MFTLVLMLLLWTNHLLALVSGLALFYLNKSTSFNLKLSYSPHHSITSFIRCLSVQKAARARVYFFNYIAQVLFRFVAAAFGMKEDLSSYKCYNFQVKLEVHSILSEDLVLKEKAEIECHRLALGSISKSDRFLKVWRIKGCGNSWWLLICDYLCS